MTEQELQAQFNAQFAALAHKHATVSYGLIAVLVVVLIMAGVGGYVGLRFADAQLARAEKQEAAYNADRKAWQDQMTTHDAQRAQDTAQQQVVVKVVDTRDKAAVDKEKQVVGESTNILKATNELGMAYGAQLHLDGTTITPDGKLALTGQQIAIVTVSELERKRLTLDLGDTKTLLGYEKDKSTTLLTDLNGCKSTVSEANKTIDGYRKAAKASRLKKVVHGVGVAVAIVAAAYLGHKL